jgi:hypothetical protein
LISVLDSISEELVKNANDDLEKSIDDLVINWLSRKIPIFTSYTTNWFWVLWTHWPADPFWNPGPVTFFIGMNLL